MKNKKHQINITLYLGILIVIIAIVLLVNTYIIPRIEYEDINNQIIKNEVQHEVTNTYTSISENNIIEDEKVDIDTNKLFELVPSSVGYIYNSQANIKYPIMHSTQSEYYLTHDYKGKIAKTGSIFMDSRNSWNDSLILIYGHNMKDNSMFGNLNKVEVDDDFTIYKENIAYEYKVSDVVIRDDIDSIYSLENPYDYNCIILSTCYTENKRLTVTLKLK